MRKATTLRRSAKNIIYDLNNYFANASKIENATDKEGIMKGLLDELK